MLGADDQTSDPPMVGVLDNRVGDVPRDRRPGDATVDSILRTLLASGQTIDQKSEVYKAAVTVKEQQEEMANEMDAAATALQRLLAAVRAIGTDTKVKAQEASRGLQKIQEVVNQQQAKLLDDSRKLLDLLKGVPTEGEVRKAISALERARKAAEMGEYQRGRAADEAEMRREDAERARREALEGAQRQEQVNRALGSTNPAERQYREAVAERERQEQERKQREEDARQAQRGLQAQRIPREGSVSPFTDSERGGEESSPGTVTPIPAAKPTTGLRRRTFFGRGGGGKRTRKKGGWRKNASTRKVSPKKHDSPEEHASTRKVSPEKHGSPEKRRTRKRARKRKA